MKRSLSYYIYAYRAKIMFFLKNFIQRTFCLKERVSVGAIYLLTKNEPKRRRS